MGASVEVDVPEIEGDGMSLPLPAAAPPNGYVLEEVFVAGTAKRFMSAAEPDDGHWTVGADGEAPFRTRLIVRRPTDVADFSGTVIVEWFNVTVIEASPEWTYLVDEVGREGHAYVGVSAQRQGVEGGATVLDVDVDDDVVADAGVSTDTGGLKNTDPARYGSLTHPGDAYSFDMFAMIGHLLAENPERILGDLVPERIIAAGESQSAAFVATFINAIHPIDPVFDGFLVHSRSVIAAPVDGDYARVRVEAGFHGVGGEVPSATLIRDDIDVPVLIFITETDLTALRYALVRQPDTDHLRTWEVAGTAHADVQLLRTIVGGPRDAMLGDLLGCGAINTGPHKEVLSAAFHHLVDWVAGGDPPPVAPRIQMVEAEGHDVDPLIARNDLGMAIGGVRNPLTDVPVFIPTGDRGGVDPAGVDGDVCALFGSTRQLSAETLARVHGSGEAYVAAFRESAHAQVDAGFLLLADAEALIAEAEENRKLFEM
ncbi:MAG: alpha/beta hydrolase domain-containing protein [Microthrixaceae bacterium]